MKKTTVNAGPLRLPLSSAQEQRLALSVLSGDDEKQMRSVLNEEVASQWADQIIAGLNARRPRSAKG